VQLLAVVSRALAASEQTHDEAIAMARIAERLASLTPRERQVLDHLVVREPNKTIAYDLGASPRTIEVHRARVMGKMGARSLSELVRIAIAEEQTRPPGEPPH
jgi:two-component system, LuxR family, response regulator FixJ